MIRKMFKKRVSVLKVDSLEYRKDADFLEQMIDQMIKETELAEKVIDDTLAFVDASNRRIANMETQAASFRKSTLKD